MTITTLIAATVTSIVSLLAAGQDPAVYEMPVIDGQAQPAIELAVAPDEAPADCAVLGITWDGAKPQWGEWVAYPFEDGELRASIVGRHLWVQWDRTDDPDSGAPDIGSVRLDTGQTRVEVCR